MPSFLKISKISDFKKDPSTIPSTHCLQCNPQLFFAVITAKTILGCFVVIEEDLNCPSSNLLKHSLHERLLISKEISIIDPEKVKIPLRYE